MHVLCGCDNPACGREQRGTRKHDRVCGYDWKEKFRDGRYALSQAEGSTQYSTSYRCETGGDYEDDAYPVFGGALAFQCAGVK